MTLRELITVLDESGLRVQPAASPAVAAGDEAAVASIAYDSRTVGNAATEIVKYFFQLHYGIKHDYRNFDLLKRGNFYQSN